MQFFPQQAFGGFIPQQQQCSSCPGNNNYFQQPQFGGWFPQQQQLYYPQQQQQFYYPQQQQQYYYPQQQQQFYYPQQQQQQWPQCFPAQNVYGYQQYSPLQQPRVYEDPSTPPPPKHRKKGEPKVYYERYYQ